jgi:hypothetical protein
VPVLEARRSRRGRWPTARRAPAPWGRSHVQLLSIQEPRRVRRRRCDHDRRPAARRALRVLRFHGSHDKVSYQEIATQPPRRAPGGDPARPVAVSSTRGPTTARAPASGTPTPASATT